MCCVGGTGAPSPTYACSLIIDWFFAAGQAVNGARVWGQHCGSQHFDRTPAVKRDLYWVHCNLNPTQMGGRGGLWPSMGSGVLACVGLQTWYKRCLWKLLLVTVVKANRGVMWGPLDVMLISDAVKTSGRNTLKHMRRNVYPVWLVIFSLYCLILSVPTQASLN